MMDNRELPIGFVMSLAMDNEAMQTYSNLSEETRMHIVDYVSVPTEGNEGKHRIEDVVHKLHNHMY